MQVMQSSRKPPQNLSATAVLLFVVFLHHVRDSAAIPKHFPQEHYLHKKAV